MATNIPAPSAMRVAERQAGVRSVRMMLTDRTRAMTAPMMPARDREGRVTPTSAAIPAILTHEGQRAIATMGMPAAMDTPKTIEWPKAPSMRGSPARIWISAQSA
ncbi:hypothetical protein ABXS69_09780 [Actinomyces timonensis]|uniref:Uncharacterized protein n=1 Tax=Actinomyces timonensis TaxID=1288391 RepID=A0AAU8N2D9_9ACTO